MPQYFHKPENALKRAKELIEVDKKSSALEALHDVIASKRHRNWTKTSEQILLLFLQLCVDMRRGKTAKDGLHQYKNMCQQVSIGSLETVIKKFVALSEAKAEEARSKATASAVEAEENVEDLEASETPENLILSTVTGEDTQDRTDREVLTPWLKFLWETYRTVLEILRNNPKLEALYQEIAQHAFQFCLKYTRKTEFRRLCDLLRTHLLNVQKYSNQSNTINLNNPDSLQLHLETRFAQLDAAAKLDLWQEAFRTIEDIHGLMGMSKKPPKPQMMATYFEQLALVFWKSDNYLFHAYAWHKLFWLSKEQKKNLTEEEATKLATHCALATLLIPITPQRTEAEEYLETDSTLAKQQQQALLVGLSQPPTRASLIQDLKSKNVLAYVPAEVRNLFTWVEDEFHPLQLCKKVAPLLEWVGQREELSSYVRPLQTVVLTRLLQQLGKVYQMMKISALQALVPFFDRYTIEKFLVDAVRTKILQVRVNHRSGTISFGADVFYSSETAQEGVDVPHTAMQSEHVLHTLTALSKGLHALAPVLLPDQEQGKAVRRTQAIARLSALIGEEHKRTLERKVIIENRKILLEEAIQRKNKIAAEQRAQQKAVERQQEQARLEAESRRRQEEQIRREREEMEKQVTMEKVVAMKKALPGSKILQNVKIEELAELDPEEILDRQVKQLEKEKKELLGRLKMVERKMDHFERAKRLEEIPKLVARRAAMRSEDMQYHEQVHQQEVERARLQHAKDLEHKLRLARLRQDQSEFVAEIRRQRQAEHDAKMAEFNKRVQVELVRRREELRICREREAAEREAEERRRQEEEARLAEEQRKAEEEAERKRKAEEERRAERERLAEIARKQAEKEREVEEKAQRMREEKLRQMEEERRGARGGADAPREEESSRPGWRRPAAEEGGEPRKTWRDREAEKSATPAAAGGSSWRDREAARAREPERERPAGPGGSSWRDKEAARQENTDAAAGARRWQAARQEEPERRDRREEPPATEWRREDHPAEERPAEGRSTWRDREAARAPPRDEKPREEKGPGAWRRAAGEGSAAGGSSWRDREAAAAPKEERPQERRAPAPERKELPKEEPQDDGFTTVTRGRR
eukprot:comp23456_c0_seq1/m.39161 comp23456_c0_seq1/g.39161  ORF comp23456_c0_seq1/g.39161 comp23456_c0_seq1/m.39161 type:complete len:1102 (-) comp23456_c0_seq1:443-3748(-)